MRQPLALLSVKEESFVDVDACLAPKTVGLVVVSACQENEAVTNDAQGEVKKGLLMVLWQGRMLGADRGMRYLGDRDKLLISLEGKKLSVDEHCLAVCEDEPAIDDFLDSSVLV